MASQSHWRPKQVPRKGDSPNSGRQGTGYRVPARQRSFASAEQISQSLVLYGILGHAAGAEARHDSTVRTSERGRLWIAHQVQAVTFG
jgi:hypothetical protein